MDIHEILSNQNDTVILCKSSEYEAVKQELTAYFESVHLSKIFTEDKDFSQRGDMAHELESHLKDYYEYEIGVPKVNYYANTAMIIRQMRQYCKKVVAILPDCPNYSALFLNVINYNA